MDLAVPLWTAVLGGIVCACLGMFVALRLWFRYDEYLKTESAKTWMRFWFCEGHLRSVRIYRDANRIIAETRDGFMDIPPRMRTCQALHEEHFAHFEAQHIVRALDLISLDRRYRVLHRKSRIYGHIDRISLQEKHEDLAT